MSRAVDDGLIAAIMDADTLDRRRLADIVHDHPLQLLAAASLRMDLLRERDPSIDESASAISSLLDSTVASLRALTAMLVTPEVEGGPGIALRRLAEGAHLVAGTHVDVTYSDSADLDERSTRAAQQIACDAVLSAGPAGARAVEIGLTESVDQVLLTLRSTPHALTASSDLLTRIAARAESTGGCLLEDSEPSTITVSWPRHRVSDR
jgi:hypothetical protein